MQTMKTKVSRHQLRGQGDKTDNAHRAVSGGATSAAQLNRRVGQACPEGYVVVERGRRISTYSLSMSVRRAADAWLRRHGRPVEA
jgi:hypothetical protein